jgi:hypothetical protein
MTGLWPQTYEIRRGGFHETPSNTLEKVQIEALKGRSKRKTSARNNPCIPSGGFLLVFVSMALSHGRIDSPATSAPLNGSFRTTF